MKFQIASRHGALRGCFLLEFILLPLVALAHTAVEPVPQEGAGWHERHQSMCEQIDKGDAGVLWIGDSIVQRWDGDGKRIWKRYYAKRHAINLGISGDRTEHVLWRLQHCNLAAVHPKLAIVMIGQNNGPHNTAEEIAEGVTAIVKLLREKQPEMKILLLGIFYRGEEPNEEQTKLARTNEIIERLADGEQITYLNVNQVFLNADGTIQASLMPDFEHPNKAGCRVWAEAIEGEVSRLLGEAPISPAK